MVASSRASAGETASWPGPGRRLSPGGSTGRGPSAATFTQVMSWPRKWSWLSCHSTGLAPAGCGAGAVFCAEVLVQAFRAACACSAGNATAPNSSITTPRPSPTAVMTSRAADSRRPASASRAASATCRAHLVRPPAPAHRVSSRAGHAVRTWAGHGVAASEVTWPSRTMTSRSEYAATRAS